MLSGPKGPIGSRSMINNASDLASFGWSNFFQSQLGLDEIGTLTPARVVAVHRNSLDVVNPAFERRILTSFSEDEEDRPTVGDWVLLGPDGQRVVRRLDRRSLFKRKAAGTDHRIQLLAANVDTVFIVSSCNQDFNTARLERYLALAREAEVEPLVILTKADLAEDASDYVAKALRLAPNLFVDTFDAREPVVLERLAPWLRSGQTIALMGSSGVGKSTLVNTLSGGGQSTAGIREDDAKGRHTTTARSLHHLPGGAWLVDMPGMRELQLADAEAGIEGLFEDIVQLETECRFSDCRHETEPGCAVQAALAAGTLDAERLARYRKLQREDALNSASLAQRRAQSRAFGRMSRAAIEAKAKRGDGS